MDFKVKERRDLFLANILKMHNIFNNCDVSLVKNELKSITSVKIQPIVEKNFYKIGNDLFLFKYV